MQETWQHLCSLLADVGIDDVRQEATIILQHVTRQTPTEFFSNLQRSLSPAESHEFAAILQRRRNREPLQYILNSAHFYGREFYVDSHVLVPRPETELMVEMSRKLIARVSSTGRRTVLADVGTGSGAIAVTLACEFPGARIVAIDKSRAAIDIARLNAARHAVSDRICLVQGDLLSALGAGLHAVIANLPYVRTGDIEQLSPEVSRFEPRAALDGGPDGLAVIARLCEQAAQVLPVAGWLLLEVGEGQAPAVLSLLSQGGRWDSLAAVADLRGIDRVVVGRLVLPRRS